MSARARMAIDIERLALAFVRYMEVHPASTLVASRDTAFEGWFRVELAATLVTIGVPCNEIDFRCPLPASAEKADLMLSGPQKIAIELKCFVAGADAHKLDAFPKQISQLSEHVRDGHFAQVIGFATMYGYSERRSKTIRASFFPSTWNVVGPFPVVQGLPLEFLVGERGSVPSLDASSA